MAFDIYGNRLERGCCEVHPWVGEEYPCSLCYTQTQERNRLNEAYSNAEKQYYEAMEAEHLHVQYMQYSEEYRTLHLREERLKKLLSMIAERKAEAINKIPF